MKTEYDCIQKKKKIDYFYSITNNLLKYFKTNLVCITK